MAERPDTPSLAGGHHCNQLHKLHTRRHDIIPEDAEQLALLCLSWENHYADGYNTIPSHKFQSNLASRTRMT